SLITSGLIVGSLFIAEIAAAQQPRHLSLEEAVTSSLAHSNELKIDESKIKAGIAAVQEAKNNRLPDVDVSGQYLRVNQPNIDLKIGSSDESASGEESGGGSFPAVNQAMIGMASASLPIFTGGKISSAIASAKYLETALRLDAQRDR